MFLLYKNHIWRMGKNMKPIERNREIIHSNPMSRVRAKNIAIWVTSWVITVTVIINLSQKVIEVRSE